MQLVSREDVFNDKLKPLLKQVTMLCDEHDIPYLLAFRTDDRSEVNPEKGPSKGTCMVKTSCHCKDCGLSIEMQLARMILTHDEGCTAVSMKLTPEQVALLQKDGPETILVNKSQIPGDSLN